MSKGPRKRGAGADGVFARSAARVAAVQALYQMDLAATDLNQVIAEFATDRIPQAKRNELIHGADPVFFADILRGVVRRQRDIDPSVDQTLATGWRLFRVDSILRAILRAATFELLERPDVPARVVINEYINVAKAFFDHEEPRVVNGVLDKLARSIRAAEFSLKEAPPTDGEDG
jgi:N utilization substance protein B